MFCRPYLALAPPDDQGSHGVAFLFKEPMLRHAGRRGRRPLSLNNSMTEQLLGPKLEVGPQWVPEKTSKGLIYLRVDHPHSDPNSALIPCTVDCRARCIDERNRRATAAISVCKGPNRSPWEVVLGHLALGNEAVSLDLDIFDRRSNYLTVKSAVLFRWRTRLSFSPSSCFIEFSTVDIFFRHHLPVFCAQEALRWAEP